LSLNLISDDPILFVLIIAAIGLCIAAVIKPTKISRKKTDPQQTASPQTGSPKAETADTARGKFCIYCGSSNKPFALYCENCGKKIA
jgi:membrane protease subunit (stomatin/prohibitin family)